MRAVLMQAFGDEAVLQFANVATPEPAPGEALVRVGAVEVSRTRDVATRTGRHPFSQQVSLPHVLGGDFAGVVEAVGTGVEGSFVGRRVAVACTMTCGQCQACLSGREAECPNLGMIGIHRWGSYAEFACVPVANVHLIPDGVSMMEAAAMAATGPIALTQLRAGAVGVGTTVLVTGATGALATAVITLANSLGATVIGTSRRPEALPPGLPLLACLDIRRDDLQAALPSLTGGRGIEVAIDNVADPDVFAAYFPALAPGGRVVISGAIGVNALPVLALPAAPLYIRSLSILGVRTTTREMTAHYWNLVANGFRFGSGFINEEPLESVAVAHARIAGGEGVGHNVLIVDRELR